MREKFTVLSANNRYCEGNSIDTKIIYKINLSDKIVRPSQNIKQNE